MNMKRYFIIGGIVVVAALVSTLLYTVLGNHGPVINSLLAEPGGVSPGGTCQIVCDAGPSGELSYGWSATGGTIGGEGAAVTWTAPIADGSYNITVTVTDTHGGQATGEITISVRANHAPFIESLTADKDWTTPSGSIQLTCDASDPDDDEVSFQWTFSGGAISGTGATVTWTAPVETGAYNITVVVRDGYGGEAVGKLSLSANSGAPPMVEKLVVTRVNNIYLRNSAVVGCDFDAYKNKHYTIECVASNASGDLSYQWSSTDGEILGESSAITWISPDKLSVGTAHINVTVTVTVSDGAGNSIVRSVVFHMASCTCGSWPLESGEVLF
jgi:PKD domain